MDNEAISQNPFDGMQSCSSNAAMWAMLATGEENRSDFPNEAAIVSSFLNMPVHIRSLLGPKLALKMLHNDLPSGAEQIKQAYLRSGSMNTDDAKLLEVAFFLNQNKPQEAEASLNDLETGLSKAEAAFALVEARYQRLLPLSPAEMTALEALEFEQGKGDSTTDFAKAMSHAKALNGHYEAAFSYAQDDQRLVFDIWNILIKIGSDKDILDVSSEIMPEDILKLPPLIRETMAARLAELGLPNLGLQWLPSPPLNNQTASRIHMLNNNGRDALRLLAADIQNAEPPLLAEAYQSIGDTKAAAQVLRNADLLSEAKQREHWLGNFSTSTEEPDSWTALSSHLVSDPKIAALPPLEAGHAILEQSAQTRTAIETLISSVPAIETITSADAP